LSFVPKILVIFASLLLFLPFMVATLVTYTQELAGRIVRQAVEITDYRGHLARGESAERDYLVDNPVRRCPDITKARTELGYHPQVSLDEGLRRTLTWYRGNPGGDES